MYVIAFYWVPNGTCIEAWGLPDKDAAINAINQRAGWFQDEGGNDICIPESAYDNCVIKVYEAP